MKEDIIIDVEVVDEKNEIVEQFDFERVNFDDSSSILRYGVDLLTEVGEIMQNISSMMRQDSNIDLDEVHTMLKGINMFDDELNKIEDKKIKQLKQPNTLITKIAKKVKKGLGIQNMEPTYYDEYEKYTENFEKIVTYLQTEKSNVIADVNMFKEFVKQIEPYIEKIEKLISIGQKDLDKYILKVEELKQSNIDNPDELVAYEISLSSQKIELFKRKLEELKKNLILTKTTIIESQMQQHPNMELVFSYDSYINNTVPVMRVKAASMVGVRRQKAKLAAQQHLINETNTALKKHSEALVGNIQQATELSVNGVISEDTLKELANNIQKGAKILIDGNNRRIKARENSDKVFKDLSVCLNEITSQISDITGQDVINLNDMYETPSIESTSFQKRLSIGPKKGN